MAEITINIPSGNEAEVIDSLCSNEFATPTIEDVKKAVISFMLGKVLAKRTAANTVSVDDIEIT